MPVAVVSSTPCSSIPATVELARVLENEEPLAKASREMLLDQKTWSSTFISLADKWFQRAKPSSPITRLQPLLSGMVPERRDAMRPKSTCQDQTSARNGSNLPLRCGDF